MEGSGISGEDRPARQSGVPQSGLDFRVRAGEGDGLVMHWRASAGWDEMFCGGIGGTEDVVALRMLSAGSSW